MLNTFFEGYIYSLAAFWTAAVRIGLPHILLLILLFCWLRKRRRGDSCCWSFGTRPACCCDDGCCRRETYDAAAGDAGHEDAEAHHDADHDQD